MKNAPHFALFCAFLRILCEKDLLYDENSSIIYVYTITSLHAYSDSS